LLLLLLLLPPGHGHGDLIAADEEDDAQFAIVFAAMGVNMETAHFFKQVSRGACVCEDSVLCCCQCCCVLEGSLRVSGACDVCFLGKVR
jgi:hypothetical protein